MQKSIWMVLAAILILAPLAAFAAEGPLGFPMRDGSSNEAHKHNQEGIDHFNQGHYDVALKHFQMASKIDPSVGESHFNEALCLDKLGRHGDATNHFYAARKYAHGNSKITQSNILNSHSPMKREGS